MICRYRFDGLSLLQCKQENNENVSQKTSDLLPMFEIIYFIS